MEQPLRHLGALEEREGKEISQQELHACIWASNKNHLYYNFFTN
jgi:hypothetical protein